MDDAQNATHGTLEELRLLLGLNLPSQPTFALVLIGDEYLLGQLQLRNHRALCSRLSAYHLLGPWTLEEIQTYLRTGLEATELLLGRIKDGDDLGPSRLLAVVDLSQVEQVSLHPTSLDSHLFVDTPVAVILPVCPRAFEQGVEILCNHLWG